MSKPKIGDRVGAFLAIQNGVGQFLGFGTYMGDEIPPNEGPESLTSLLAEMGQTNPKILLDDGEVVWGCECWWSGEEETEIILSQNERVDVSIKDARRPQPATEAPMGDFFGLTPSEPKDFWS